MQTSLSFQLAFLASDQVAAVLQIAAEQFGQFFLDESHLRSYLQSDSRFCHVVLHEGEVVGFSLMEINSAEGLASKMKEESAWFLAYFKNYNPIGYRSLTAVSKAFEGKGIAQLLIHQGLAFLSQKTEVVVCDAWKSSFTHIGKALERNGYEAIREVPDYWAAESLREQYDCPHCGLPPCRCSVVFYAKFFVKKQPYYWWQRPDLCYQQGSLSFAGKSLADFIKNKKTPFYIYNIHRIIEKYEQIQQALAAHTVPFSIYYAMKANRHPAILSHLKARTNAGLDVCSPNELDLAFQYGFDETALSYTGTSMADHELRLLASYAQLRINFDSLSAVRRFLPMTSSPRNIGIRINPSVGMAYNQSLEYSGDTVVKFGVYPEQWQDLQQLVRHSHLHITTVHCHAGSGFLSDQLPRLALILEKIDAFLELFPEVETLNMGGGLGVPQSEGDLPLDLAAWAAILCDYAQRRGLKLAFEPGDFLVKDAGILITQVNTVEEKKGKHFVGIDTGMNMNYEYAYYQMNLEAVPIREPQQLHKTPTSLAGNINEPIDLFSEEKLLPALQEGDYLALLHSGGYGASTASNHCMRGDFKEYVFI